MYPHQPFPFMRLPIELRLMVYERVPVQIKRHAFIRLNNTRNPSAGSYSFTIVSKSIDLSILSTCHQLNTEAAAVMRAKMEDILGTPPHLVVDLLSAPKIHKCGGPLWHMSHHLAKRAVSARKHLGSVPYLGTGLGASGARYSPESDLDYPLLAHLMERWFRSLDHQRGTSSRDEAGYPSIELAITAPRTWPHQTVLHALRQLAYVLFAEHGGFQFTLRNANHLFPPCTDNMRKQEQSLLDKVTVGRRYDAVKGGTGTCYRSCGV